jgi:hypothetical protein
LSALPFRPAPSATPAKTIPHPSEIPHDAPPVTMRLTFSARAMAIIEGLVQTGLYGRTPEEVAERLVTNELRNLQVWMYRRGHPPPSATIGSPPAPKGRKRKKGR